MKVAGRIKNIFDNLPKILTDQNRMKVLQTRVVYGTFAVIALVMSVMNIVTDKKTLLLSTALFCGLCVLNLILTYFSEKALHVSSYLFMVEILFLFSFFIITGGTDKFSIIWTLLLPTIGLFFFGLKRGSLMCAIILAVMLCVFYIPGLSGFCVDYGKTFMARFPLVFVSSYIVSLLLEMIRVATSHELEILRHQYEILYKYDELTGVYNRYGMQTKLNESLESGAISGMAAMVDIDFFKKVNDTYGHLMGDQVLKEVAGLISENIPDDAFVTRWGGEEFVVVYQNEAEAEENLKKIHELVRLHEFRLKEKIAHITVSIGVTRIRSAASIDELDEVLMQADQRLYTAKETGRNKIVFE